MFSVYIIVNTLKMKGYVGFTGMSVDRRFRKHLSDARKGSKWLVHAAIRKYGESNFHMEVLHTVNNREEAVELERKLIVYYCTKKPLGYNMTDGGDGAPGYRHTEEWKKKLGLSRKGKKLPPHMIELMRSRMLGWVPSPETRLRMAQSQTGRKHSAATICKMQESAKRRWQTNPPAITPEWQARMRTLSVGVVRSEAHRDAVRKALTGLKRSPETIERVRKAAVARHLRRKQQKTDVPRETPVTFTPSAPTGDPS